MSAAITVLITSGSILVAFLTYVIAGVVLTLVAASLSVICAPVRRAIATLVNPTHFASRR